MQHYRKPVLARSASSAINTGFLCRLPSLRSSELPPSSRVLHKYVHLFNFLPTFLIFLLGLRLPTYHPTSPLSHPPAPTYPFNKKEKSLAENTARGKKSKGKVLLYCSQCSKTAFLIFVLFSFSLFFFFFFCFVPGNGMVTFSRLPENTTTSVGCVSRDGTNCVTQNRNARVCRRSC